MRNLALVWVLAGCLLGCGGKPSDTTFTDTRDGKVYRIVEIGSQTWFAENLNYAAEGSVCYDNRETNCAKYGHLYDWETAQQVCPVGWHLPSDDEWTTLVDYAGGWETAGTKLKSTSGWNHLGKPGNGTDDYGFSALPGSSGNSNGDFFYPDYLGKWWSATEYVIESYSWSAPYATVYNTMNAWQWGMIYGREGVYRDYHYKTNLFSVRCIQDNGKEQK